MSITFLIITYHHIVIYNYYLRFLKQLGLDSFLTQFNFDSSVFSEVTINWHVFVVAYIFLLLSSIMITFFWYWLTHLFVKLFGGKHGYDQTYKAMTYSLSVDYLTLPAFIVSIISLTSSISSGSLISFVIFIISTILYLIPSFYRLYIRLVGLEKLQEITKVRAFVAAYILPYVTITVLEIAFIMILFIILIFF